jgi:hypothetical protein
MKPGTLALIVKTAPEWSCALGHVVTITGRVSFPPYEKEVYTFQPPKKNGWHTTNRGFRECFKPLDDPNVTDESAAFSLRFWRWALRRRSFVLRA